MTKMPRFMDNGQRQYSYTCFCGKTHKTDSMKNIDKWKIRHKNYCDHKDIPEIEQINFTTNEFGSVNPVTIQNSQISYNPHFDYIK
jgi:hypothetical protein